MQSATKRKSIDMTQGSPIKLILLFTAPLLLGNILQQLYNITDMVVVGNFAENGTRCIAAVGAAAPVMFLLFALFMGVGQGASVVISQFFGARDTRNLKRAVDTILFTLMVCVIPVTLLGLALSKPLLLLMKIPPETLDQALTYMRIIMLGIFANFGMNVNAGILQGIGDSKSPVLFLGISIIGNIILDILFVIVLGWDVMGVALATVLAQIAAFLFGIFHINRMNLDIKIRFRGLEFDGAILKECIRIGLPAGLQNMLFSIGTMFLQGLVNGYGEEYMAGFTAAQKVDSIAFMPIISFAAAVTTFVGQNIGAGKYDRVKSGVRSATVVSIIVSSLITALVLPVSGYLLRIFDDNPNVVRYGQEYLVRIMPFFIFLAVLFMHNNALRGAGISMIPLVSSILSLWAVRVPVAYLLDWLFGQSNMYFSFGIGWMVGAVFSVAYYTASGWLAKLERARAPVPDEAPADEPADGPADGLPAEAENAAENL